MRIGERIGNYVLESLLGQGGQAEVYLARDVSLHRLAAVKICLHATTLVPVQEARLLARLDHPGIVKVYHLERAGNYWYIALEYLEGGSVAELLKRSGPPGINAALAIGRDAAAAMAHAHSRDIVHGDLKPQNMLFSRSGRVCIIDFGLAVTGRVALISKSPVGTPYFMASEIWDGAPPGKPADVYALAVVICQLLSGKPPFPANDVEELRRLQKTDAPQFADSVPRHMRDLLSGCLSRDPTQRPSTKELAAALDRLARGTKREGKKEPKKKKATSSPPNNEAALALSGLVEIVLGEYASATILSKLVSARLKDRDILGSEPSVVLLPGDAGRLQRLAIEHTCGPVEWRSIDTLATEPVVASTDGARGRTVVGVELSQAMNERLVASAAASAADMVKRGVHVVALGPADSLDQFGRVAAARDVATRKEELLTFTRDELLALVRQWTADVTAQKVCWTWSALIMAAGSFERGTAPIDRTMHNALMLCLAGRQRIVTTWHVSGAVAHAQYLLDASAIRTEWLRKPTPWPPTKLPFGSRAPSVLRDSNMNANADEVET